MLSELERRQAYPYRARDASFIFYRASINFRRVCHASLPIIPPNLESRTSAISQLRTYKQPPPPTPPTLLFIRPCENMLTSVKQRRARHAIYKRRTRTIIIITLITKLIYMFLRKVYLYRSRFKKCINLLSVNNNNGNKIDLYVFT